MSPTRNAQGIIRCGQRTVTFGRVPAVMGILNVTPDSFSDGGLFVDHTAAVTHAHEMVAGGAQIVDVGGESTRPRSDGISEQEELARVIPICEALVDGDGDHDPLDAIISIDTRKPAVADAALRLGVHMVNEISAAEDPRMVDVLREHGDTIPVVIMHRKGDPKTMQDQPHYVDVTVEICQYLRDRADALIASGIATERIIVDPGIGFGKRVVDNLTLLKNIDALRGLGYPLLVGASRKTFIGKLTRTEPSERLAGSLAAAARCFAGSVEIVRVHDVRETIHLFRLLDAMDNPGEHARE